MATKKQLDDATQEALSAIERALDDQAGGAVARDGRIGRAVERSGRVDAVKLWMVLAGELETTELTADEKAAWSQRFLATMSGAGAAEEAFFAELRRSGGAVGLDPAGKIVYADARPEA